MTSRISILALALLVVAGIAGAGDVAWFDMENCAMCKNLYAHEGLIQNITWEQHPISGGIISVTTVNGDHLKAYRAAHADMQTTAMKMQKGEMMAVCGSCTALGKCMMMGPNMEYVETSSGDVFIMTSDNPELVKELQAWAAKNKEEMAKMKAEKKG